MGFGGADLLDDRDAAAAAGGGKAASPISCSICLDDVTDYGDRAWAKLQCGHQFHLDCIGSAFNVKGVMQCPNCRKIEKGQWLFADGYRPYPELNIDDLVNDEDLYELSYSDSSMWCPFGGFTRVAAAFDEVEYPTTAYHDLVGHHAVFSEHATAHICPYIAYVQPLHPSTSSANFGDGSRYNNNNNNNNNNNQWNNQSVSSEIPNSYGFPAMDVDHQYPSLPSMMPRRAPRTNVDMPRSGSYVHPFLVGQSSSTSNSSMIHPYPGSAARARERSQALEAYFQHLPAAARGSHRSNSSSQVQVGHAGSTAYYPSTSGSSTAEYSLLNPFQHNIWERDPVPNPTDRGLGSFHQPRGFRSNRTTSQSQYWV